MKGRPRITPEELQGRVADYCSRYAVAAAPSGLPPFPAGQRETPQHREWIVLYKTHSRMAGRARKPQDASDGAACPVCQNGIRDEAHQECAETLKRVEALGPEGLDRLRAHLWPAKARKTRSR